MSAAEAKREEKAPVNVRELGPSFRKSKFTIDKKFIERSVMMAEGVLTASFGVVTLKDYKTKFVVLDSFNRKLLVVKSLKSQKPEVELDLTRGYCLLESLTKRQCSALKKSGGAFLFQLFAWDNAITFEATSDTERSKWCAELAKLLPAIPLGTPKSASLQEDGPCLLEGCTYYTTEDGNIWKPSLSMLDPYNKRMMCYDLGKGFMKLLHTFELEGSIVSVIPKGESYTPFADNTTDHVVGVRGKEAAASFAISVPTANELVAWREALELATTPHLPAVGRFKDAREAERRSQAEAEARAQQEAELAAIEAERLRLLKVESDRLQVQVEAEAREAAAAAAASAAAAAAAEAEADASFHMVEMEKEEEEEEAPEMAKLLAAARQQYLHYEKCLACESAMHLDGPHVPMALVCGHSICGDCQDVVAQAHVNLRLPDADDAPAAGAAGGDASKGGETEKPQCRLECVRCPLCKMWTQLGTHLQGSGAVLKLKENEEFQGLSNGGEQEADLCGNCEEAFAVKLCNECGELPLCMECKEEIHSLPCFEHHVVSPMEDLKCKAHPGNTTDFVCFEPGCNKCMVCVECAGDGHQGHSMKPAASVADDLRADMEALIAEGWQMRQRLLKKAHVLSGRLDAVVGPLTRTSCGMGNLSSGEAEFVQVSSRDVPVAGEQGLHIPSIQVARLNMKAHFVALRAIVREQEEDCLDAISDEVFTKLKLIRQQQQSMSSVLAALEAWVFLAEEDASLSEMQVMLLAIRGVDSAGLARALSQSCDSSVAADAAVNVRYPPMQSLVNALRDFVQTGDIAEEDN